jgi:SM-20-related protein
MLKQNEINISIGEGLRNESWWMGNLLPSSLLNQLNTDARKLSATQQFSKAAIGASHSKLIDTAIRGDHTYWLSGSNPEPNSEPNPTQQNISQEMLSLKNTFESYFPILLNNFEGHYSYYPVGTFYKKHMDNARNTNNRVFSVVTYFNEDWREGDGGELVLYSPDDGRLITEIKPHFGMTVIFFSADFPHEVKETQQTRYSLTGWFTHK